MTPAEIALARRIIACGLPTEILMGRQHGTYDRPVWIPAGTLTGMVVGDTRRDSRGILWRFVSADPAVVLLPVLDDFALLGWLITEARRRLDQPHLRTRWSKSGQRWEVYGDSGKYGNVVGHYVSVGPTEIEALTAALEAAKNQIEAANAAKEPTE